MIDISLYYSADERFRGCGALGHAEYAAKGKDIVCAAVTVLLRTTMSVLGGEAGLKVEAEAPSRGTLSFRVTESAEQRSSLLVYAGEFLSEGLLSLEKEFPGALRVQFLKENDW